MNYVLPIFINMQTSATILLETIIRDELSLLKEQVIGPKEKEKINKALKKLFPCLHKKLGEGLGAPLNQSAINDAVYEKLMSDDQYEDNNWKGDCGESGHVIKRIWDEVFPEKTKVQKQDPNWPVNIAAGGNVFIWTKLLPHLQNGIAPNYGKYGGKEKFFKLYPGALQFIQDPDIPGAFGNLTKSARDIRSASLVNIPWEEQEKYIRQATPIAKKIINARGGLLPDEETIALAAVLSIKDQMQYYWVNKIVSEHALKVGLAKKTYYTGIPDFLNTFSGKSIVDVEAPISTAISSFGYLTATGKSSTEGNVSGYKTYLLPKQRISRLNLEKIWWEKILNKLEQLENQNWEHWNEKNYFPYGNTRIKPLSYHIQNVSQIIHRLELMGRETKSAYEKEKAAVSQQQGTPYIVKWFQETLDDNPAEVLSTMALVTSFASGPVALLWTLGFGAGATGLYFEQGDIAAGGTEAIFTIILSLSGIRRLESVKLLGTAARTKVAEALAKSDISFLNQVERVAFADIAKYISKNKTAVQNGIKKKIQDFINTTGEKVLRQRIVNQLRNSRLTPYTNVVSKIYNDIKSGLIFNASYWTGKTIKNTLTYGPPGLEVVAYTQAPSGAGYWNDIYANTKIDTKYGKITGMEYDAIRSESEMIDQLVNGEFDAESSGADMDLVNSINFNE